MIWKVLYLTIFSGGLALAVISMLHGIERWKLQRSAKPSAVLNPPTVAALAVGVGASGYLLQTRSHLGSGLVFFIALCFGIASLAGMIVLMAKWALRNAASPSAEEDDINGQVATVTRPIKYGGSGEISWVAWNTNHVLPAQSLDGSDVETGEEVVIDVVKEGVAMVELWSVVERRL